jgi:hypothetical protein
MEFLIAKAEFVIYYWHTDPFVNLTEIETVVIKSFSFENLYVAAPLGSSNFKKEANSSLGYKHTIDAIHKMKLRFKNKSNHPMFVCVKKTHTSFALSKISKPGKLRSYPMFVCVKKNTFY